MGGQAAGRAAGGPDVQTPARSFGPRLGHGRAGKRLGGGRDLKPRIRHVVSDFGGVGLGLVTGAGLGLVTRGISNSNRFGTLGKHRAECWTRINPGSWNRTGSKKPKARGTVIAETTRTRPPSAHTHTQPWSTRRPRTTARNSDRRKRSEARRHGTSNEHLRLRERGLGGPAEAGRGGSENKYPERCSKGGRAVHPNP